MQDLQAVVLSVLHREATFYDNQRLQISILLLQRP